MRLSLFGVRLSGATTIVRALSAILCLSGAPSVADAQSAPPGAVAWDTFTGTTGTSLTSHAPDVAPVGAAWVHWEGSTETLQANRVGIASSSGFTVAAIAAGVAHGTTAADLVSPTTDGYGGVVFRAVDVNANLLLRYAGSASAGLVGLFRRVAGDYVLVQQVSVTPAAPTTVHRIEARYTGTTVQAVWDGTVLFSATVTDYQTATGAGLLWHSDVPASQFDNFSVISGTAATISSLAPTSGLVGATVTLTGTNFGATQGPSTVKFNGTTATATAWSATSITATVPAGATTGNVVITVGAVASNGVSFTVTPGPSPTISSLTPTSGPIGATVTVTGTNFGATQGPSTVTFNGATATATAWSATSLTTTVPAGATTGNVVVTVGGLASTGVTYTVTAPSSGGVSDTFTGTTGTSLTSHAPDMAPAGAAWAHWEGSTETLQGNRVGIASSSGFTVAAIAAGVAHGTTAADLVSPTTDGYGGVVFRAVDVNANLLLRYAGSASAGLVGLFRRVAGDYVLVQQVSVTPAAPTTVHRIEARYTGTTVQAVWDGTVLFSATVTDYQTATGAGLLWHSDVPASQFDNFSVISGTAATISSLAPTSGLVGATVTLTGTNFGATQGPSTVKFNGTTATATAWSATSITATVPAGATTGNVVITVGAVASNGVSFTVTPGPSPTISSLTPTSGPIGATVTVTGTNFGATQGPSTVTFNGTTATATAWSATSLTTTVPAGATTGNVVVTVGGLASTGVTYTVTAPSSGGVSDTFTGTTGTSLTSHAPDMAPAGAAWAHWEGSTETLQGNRVGIASSSGFTVAAIAAGVAHGTTAADLVSPTTDGYGGVVFRAVDVNANLLLRYAGSASAGLVGLFRRVAGDYVLVQQVSVTPAAPTTVHRIEARYTGTTVQAVWDGTVLFSATVTDYQTATGAGLLWHSDVPASQFDNFSVISGTAATISSLAPTSGLVGATVTLTGTNFGATQGPSTVKFNGTTATATAWSATSITATVPAGATTGNVVITVGAVASNGVSFTVTPGPSPTISSLTPTSGPIGATVTVTGTNFGATQGPSTVTFNGATATATAWSATSLTTTVPAGATTGNVVVTVGGLASTGVTYTVTAPSSGGVSDTFTGTTGTSLTSHAPDMAPAGAAWAHWEGSTETLQGNRVGIASSSGFTVAAIAAGVAHGTTAADLVSPTTDGYGGVVFRAVDVNANLLLRYAGSASAGLVGLFRRVAGDYVLVQQVSVTPAAPTTVHRIEARYTGTTVQAVWDGTVLFSATVTDYQTATGAGLLWHSDVPASQFDNFSVISGTAATISSLAPTSGLVGATVTLTGTNFGATQGPSTVKFNGTTASPSAWSATSITVNVPADATTGPVVVTVGGQATDGLAFTVVPSPPTISTVSPASGSAGTPVTIAGTNFGSAQGTSVLRFNGTTATVTNWSSTSITAAVPSGATTGPVVVTASGLPSNGVTFTATSPAITILSPGSGAAGTRVTVSGANFGATQGGSTVSFNGTPAWVLSWSAMSIVVTVPTGATTGPVVVTANSQASNGVVFTTTLTGAVVSDTFTGTSGSSLQSHTPDIAPAGAVWTYVGNGTSVARILANWTLLAAPGTGHQPWALNVGQSNATISADFIGGTLRVGALVLRASSGANYLGVSVDGSDLLIDRMQNGVRTILARTSVGFVSGHVYRLEARAVGNSIEAYVDGALKLAAIETFQETATRYGISFNADDPSAAFDNLAIFPPGWAPMISGPANQTHVVGATIAPTPIVATDPEAASLTYGANGLPAGLSVSATTGQITGTLTAGVGTYTVLVSAFDGIFTSTRSVRWTVLASAQPPPPLARVFDTFTSVGAPVLLPNHAPGVTWSGSAWSLLEGSTAPMVDAGEVVSGSSPTGYVVAAIESGTADGVVAVDVRSSSATPRAGIVLRAANAGNFLLLRYTGRWGSGQVELLRRVDGVFSIVTAVPVGPLDAVTHRLEARLTGLSITALWDGASLFNTVINDNQGSTRHGLLWDVPSDSTTTYDNFKVTTEAFAPTLPPGTICEATLSRRFVPMTSEHGSPALSVTMPHSGCGWTARLLSGSSPISGSPTRIGSGPVQFNVSNNQGLFQRVEYFSVAGSLVTLVQGGTNVGECSYTLTPTSLVLDRGGDEALVSVAPAYEECSWTAVSNRSWITVPDTGVRVWGGSFVVTVGPSPDLAARSGSIFIGPFEVTVTQPGEGCDFTVSPTSFTVSADAESHNAYVTAPNGCGWEAVSLSSFIGITENPTGSGTLNFRISIQNNPPASLPRVGYVEVRRTGYTPRLIAITQCAQGQGVVCGVDPGGEVSYFHTDAIGSVRMVTGAAGQVIARYDYLPFGGDWGTSPSFPNSVKFTGKERDTETAFGGWNALDYFGARYYASQTGRFTTVDPVLDMKGALVDPQQWNRYTYVRNNPFRYVDPDGRCSKPADQKEGETGVCIEAFIADSWFSGIARGDNRGFSGTDPKLTARSRVKVTVRADGKVTSEVVESERSGVLCKGCGLKGDTVASVSSKQNDDRSISVHVSLWGRNGEYFLSPLAPSGVLQGNVNINISATGEVSLVLSGSGSTTFPSWGVYGYPSTGGVTTLREQNQQTIDGLQRPPEPWR